MKARPPRARPAWPPLLTEFFATAPAQINGKGFTLKMGTLWEYEGIHISPSWEYDNYFSESVVDLLEELESTRFFADQDELDDFRARFVPMFIQSMDDTWSFNAFLIDISEAKLPIYVFGWESEGRLSKKADSLAAFSWTYLGLGLGGADAAPSPDPEAELKKLYKRLIALLDKKKNEEKVIELATEFCESYPAYLEPDLRESLDVDHSRLVGGFFNLIGVAHNRGGDKKEAIRFYEKARDLGDTSSLLNLAELYCYTAGEYEQARVLSRGPVNDDDAWYYKVKVDAYASLMLGDMEQSLKCYRLLQDKYLWLDSKKIDTAREELEELDTKEAQKILNWFGVKKEITEQDVAENRKWWDQLEPAWQKQLREQLPKKAKKQKITDDRIAYFRQMRRFRMDSDYKVSSLEPLLELCGLTELKINYASDWSSALAQLALLGRMTQLEKLHLESMKLTNLDLVRTLVELRELDTGSFFGNNAIRDISGVSQLSKLEVLKVQGARITDSDQREGTLADLSPLQGLSKLKRLVVTRANVTDDSFAKNLPNLEVLRIRNAAFEKVDFIGNLPKLKKLELGHCERLKDISALGALQTLTYLKIDSCPIEELSVIGRLEKLEKLELRKVSAPSIDFLRPLKGLKDVELSYSGVDDISSLATLSELEYLTVFETTQSFSGLPSLYDLPKLKRLAFQKRSIQEGSRVIREFEKRRPELRFRDM